MTSWNYWHCNVHCRSWPLKKKIWSVLIIVHRCASDALNLGLMYWPSTRASPIGITFDPDARKRSSTHYTTGQFCLVCVIIIKVWCQYGQWWMWPFELELWPSGISATKLTHPSLTPLILKVKVWLTLMVNITLISNNFWGWLNW